MNQDVKRTRPEFGEMYDDRVTDDIFSGEQERAQAGEQCFHLISAGAVGHAQGEADMPSASSGDRGGCKRAVGDADFFVAPAPDARRTQPDMLDDAFHIWGFDEVTDHERPVANDRREAEQVRDGFLRGQREGQTTQPQTGRAAQIAPAS